MKKINLFSWITFVMDLLISLFGFGLFISLYYFDGITDFINKTWGYVENVNPESVSAGYEVIGGMFLAGAGVVGYLMIAMVAMMGLIVGAYFLIGVLINLISRLLRKKEERYLQVAKVEAILQMVLHGLACLLCMVGLFQGLGLYGLLGIAYCGIPVYLNYLQMKETSL